MARERWHADDYEITAGFVRDLETYEGLLGSAPITATDISVPLRDGELDVPGRLGPGGFTIRMWLGGANRADIEGQWEQLLRVLVKRHRLVRWTHRRADGTTREAYGRVVGKIDPTPIGRLGIRAQIEVLVPSGVWQNTQDVDTGVIPILSGGPLVPVDWADPSPGRVLLEDQVPRQGPSGPLSAFRTDGSASYTGGWEFGALTHTFTRAVSSPGPIDRYVDLHGFAGASAPLTRLRFDIAGTLEGLRITCPETGEWAAYDIPLLDGQRLHIDAEKDVVTAPRVDAFRYKGPYMMEALPNDNPNVKPILRVQATQAGLGASIRVRGRRLYLI